MYSSFFSNLLLNKNANKKSGNCDALQLEAAAHRQVVLALIAMPITHQPTNSTIPHGIFRQSVSNYQCLFSNAYCACAETPVSELPVIIASVLFDLVT